jgi:uncharacterized protein (TIGR03435 family)
MNRRFFTAIGTVNAKGLGPCLRTLMLLSAVAGLAVLVSVNGPQIRAQAGLGLSAPKPSFEVAAIKPSHPGTPGPSFGFHGDGITIHSVTLKAIMGFAFNVRDFQIFGGPSWINSDRYDTEAKEPEAVQDGMLKLDFDQRIKLMGQLLQSLLADRFQLKVTHDTKELPVYALVVAKNGPKFQEAKPNDTYANGFKGLDGRPVGGHFMRMGPGEIDSQGTPMTFLVQQLSQQLGRTVLDRTGLKGKYDFTLKWTPDLGSTGMMPGSPPGAGPGPDSAPPDISGPSIFTAIQEQLGLKLVSTKGPVQIIVIDYIERPSEN